MIKILTIAFTLLSFAAFAQGEKVDAKKMDYELLNKYILKEVNAQRKRKRVDSLISDEILERAAEDHANYMSERQEIGHGQKVKNKENPYDRVVFYEGAHNQVGENVQAFNLNAALKKSKGRLTYEKLAKEMVKVWVKSKPHYKNLIEKNYANVGHSYVLRDGVLFACQVFGSKPFEPAYEFEKGNALFVKQKQECFDCKQVKKKIYNDEVSLGWYTVSNDSIFYWNRNHYIKRRFYNDKKGKFLMNSKRNNLRKVFKAGGTITIDVLHNEQFDCSGKASFHNSLYYNGYYLGAVNRDRVKYQDLNPSPELVQIFVGMKPAFADTFYQVDFHLLKKHRKCIQTSTIYVSPDYLKPYEYFTLPKPKVTLDKNLIIEDSVVTKVPFKRNQTNEDTSIFKPLLTKMDSLIKENHQIETISFTGVASIEGTEKANKKLFLKRGAIIQDYLKRYYPDVPFESAFYENFDDFRSGLVSVGYTDVNEITDDTLRMFANDQRDDKEIAEILDQTRFSTIKIVYRDYFPIEEGSYGLSVDRINDLMKEDKVNEITPLYLLMANNILEEEMASKEELLALEFPEERTYSRLHWYKFLFNLAVDQNSVNAEKLNQLNKLGAISSDANYLEYRLLFNLFNRNNAIDVSDSEQIIENIREKKLRAWIESLLLITQVENFQTSSDAVTPLLLENVLKKKFDLKQTYFICQYLVDWGYTVEPYVLLSKFARRPNQIPKLYMQYLKLGYFLQQFDNSREWKKIRNVVKNLAENHPTEFCRLFQWDQMGIGSLTKKEIAELFCEKCKEDKTLVNQ